MSRVQIAFQAVQATDGKWFPGQLVSGMAIVADDAPKDDPDVLRHTMNLVGKVPPEEPFFYIDAPLQFIPASLENEDNGNG